MADNWSDCGQVFYYGEKAFGLTAELDTICLGDTEIIKRALEDGQLPDKLNVAQRLVLTDILEYRKEKNGEDIGTGGLERSKPMRTTRYNKKTTRLPKKRKGLSLRPTPKKH